MAATHLTLEQAAERLGISPEEFKRRLKTDQAFKTLDRGKIRDGTSFRFKDSAVDELARELGSGSDPDMPALSGADEPLNLGGDDDDVFSLTTDEPKPEPKAKKPTKGPDSDIRLDASMPSKPTGSKSGKLPKVNEGGPGDEIAIDFSDSASAVHKKGPASSTKLSAPRSSTRLTSESGKNLSKSSNDDSEFELSLDADSDDFELKLGGDSDEDDAIDLGEMPKDVPGGSRVGRGGESGILSRKPNDTGRSLEKGGKSKTKLGATPASEEPGEVDFELTLDGPAGGGSSGPRLGSGKPKKAESSTDSEFELTLDDEGAGSLEHAALGESDSESSKGDIFETDFEIPPMEESGSEAVSVETAETDLDKSDFDVAIDDSDIDVDTEASGSEVVLLEDDEDAPSPKARRKAADTDDDVGDVDLADVEPVDDEEDGSIAGALKGVKSKRRDEDDEEEEFVPAGAYRPVPWGPLPALFLMPALVVTLIGGLMGFELLQTMWGYQQPQKPAAPLVREIAKAFEMELKDQ
jgi:hypothetical protein